MRILWPHNFNPDVQNSQVFMNIAASGLKKLDVDLHLEYLGNLRSIKNLIQAKKRLQKVAKNFDVLHAQYGSSCGLAGTAVDDIPKVLSIRGNDWNLHNRSIEFLYFHTRLARFFTKRSLEHYDCILTVSNRMADDIRCYTSKRVVSMPSPINLEIFIPRNKSEAKASLGFPDCNEKWVLFNALNLNDPVKRFDLARKAFDLANKRMGNLRFRIATDLPHADLPLFVASCDVIVTTSESEGWPNCIKEALACNVPFVATDVSDLREITDIDPLCRVCQADPEILADNICEVLSEDTTDKNLRKHVENMSLTTYSMRLVEIYDSLLKERK